MPKEPHEKLPAEGFDLLMRRDKVMDLEVGSPDHRMPW